MWIQQILNYIILEFGIKLSGPDWNSGHHVSRFNVMRRVPLFVTACHWYSDWNAKNTVQSGQNLTSPATRFCLSFFCNQISTEGSCHVCMRKLKCVSDIRYWDPNGPVVYLLAYVIYTLPLFYLTNIFCHFFKVIFMWGTSVVFFSILKIHVIWQSNTTCCCAKIYLNEI